jgi:hypothetical protein
MHLYLDNISFIIIFFNNITILNKTKKKKYILCETNPSKTSKTKNPIFVIYTKKNK